MHDVLHVAQPVVGEAKFEILHRGLHAAAAVVPANDYVTDPQQIYRELKHRKAIEVSVDNYVRNVAVDEQLPRREADELSCGHTTVRTTDPQVARSLLLSQGLKESRVLRLYTLGPGPIILKQLSQVPHISNRSVSCKCS